MKVGDKVRFVDDDDDDIFTIEQDYGNNVFCVGDRTICYDLVSGTELVLVEQ